MRRLAASAVLALLVAACGLGLVDGWSLGDEVACPERAGDPGSLAPGRCEDMVEMAAGHAGIDAATPARIHREGSYGNTLSNRSGGGMYVVVFDTPGFDDVVVGVFCGVGGCRPGGQPAVRP